MRNADIAALARTSSLWAMVSAHAFALAWMSMSTRNGRNPTSRMVDFPMADNCEICHAFSRVVVERASNKRQRSEQQMQCQDWLLSLIEPPRSISYLRILSFPSVLFFFGDYEMFDQFDTQVEATQAEELKAQNSQEFKELKFLDSAELALIGGGGAHGGNFI